MESERWRAESLNGEQLEVGDVVKVLSVDGVRLQVKAADNEVDTEQADSDEHSEPAA